MAEFIINTNTLDESGKDFAWPVPARWLETELASADLRPDPAAPEGRLEVTAQKNGQGFLVRGRLDVQVLARCARCLEDARISVSTDLVGLLTPPGAAGGAGQDMGENDLDPALLSGEELRLDPWVREHIVVECPMRPLCGDDCNALEVPAHIRPPDDFGGKSEGVDPRLRPLLELKDKVLPNKE